MFAAPLLAAALITSTAPAPLHHGASLVSQSERHAGAIAMSRRAAPLGAEKDHRWDGALAGGLAGAGAGALAGLLLYGRGDGEWADRGPVMAGMTFWGAIIGGSTGLVIDLIRR